MDSILKLSSEYVSKILKYNLPEGIVYHNLSHTIDVVEAAKEIGSAEELNDNEMEMLQIAAWFHDTGLTKSYLNHEEKSVEICRSFLNKHNYPPEKIDPILNIIKATELPHSPTSLIEKIICDADILHIGRKGFSAKTIMLRIEWEKMNFRIFSDEEWLAENINFLQSTNFHTDYAQQKYGTRKLKNLEKLKQKFLLSR
jgi:HD superfamily phosphodiesterase